MATYREVVNVPSVPGTNELVPQPWAMADIDYGIEHGYINVTDGHRDDWLEIVGSGRYWSFTRRKDLPRRVGNLEDDVVALAATGVSQLAVNAIALEAHDAIMSVLRANDTQIKALQSRVTETENQIANLMLLLPPPPPTPTGDWWDIQRAAAETVAAAITGADGGAPVHTTKQTVTGLRENFVVENVNGRALQLDGADAIARDFRITDSGSGFDDGSRIQSRNPAVHTMTGGNKKATLENFEILRSPVQGLAGGNHPNTEVIVRRGHFADNTTLGLGFTYPPAVTAAIKLFGIDTGLLEDLFIENQAGAGAWVDGSNAHDVTWRRGLYQGITGPSIFPELLVRALIENPTVVGGEILVDAEDVQVVGAAMFSARGIRSRPSRRDGGRTISTKVSGSFLEFTSSSFYGWNSVPADTTHSFLSGGAVTGGAPNTFKLNRDWDIFRVANARLTYAQWVDQTGNDADADIIEVP